MQKFKAEYKFYSQPLNEIFPKEILLLIVQYLDFKSHIYFLSHTKYFYNNEYLYPTKIGGYQFKKIIDTKKDLRFLKQKKFKNLIELNLSYINLNDTNVYIPFGIKKLNIACSNINESIFDNISKLDLTELNLSHTYRPKNVDFTCFSNLKILKISSCGIINQKTIRCFDLIELDAHRNPNINDVSFMKNLKILNASYDHEDKYGDRTCGINQNGIKGLDLIELNAYQNVRIFDVSFMRNLRRLNIGGPCGVNQKGIDGLDLHELDVSYNKGIYDLTYMINLKKLIAVGCYDYKLSQAGIIGLNLVELDVSKNKLIKDVSFMTNLKRLNASEYCGIDQDGIKNLDLVYLNADGNNKIYDVSFMKNLRELHASTITLSDQPYWISEIDQNGINGLNLYILGCCDNPKIKDVSNMRYLQRLFATGNSGICPESIVGLKLKTLVIRNNKNFIGSEFTDFWE